MVAPKQEERKPALRLRRVGTPTQEEFDASSPPKDDPFATLRLIVAPYSRAEFIESSRRPEDFQDFDLSDYVDVTGDFVLITNDMDYQIVAVHISNLYGRVIEDDKKAREVMADLGEWISGELKVRPPSPIPLVAYRTVID
jgi:hypothetical protein